MSKHTSTAEMAACQLVIDDRETYLVAALVELRVPHVVEHLDVGDVLYRVHGRTAGVFERKTSADLAASIVDKRWTEQKTRLADLRLALRSGDSPIEQGAPIGYIFEGDFYCARRTHSLPPATLLKTSTTAAARDGFCTLFYGDVRQTARALAILLAEMPFVGFCEARVVDRLRRAGYATEPPSLSKREREAAPDVVFHRMLRCIPGVSAAVSATLASRFKSIPALQQVLATEAGLAKIVKLHRSGRGGGKGRRLGPALGQALRQHLQPPTQSCTDRRDKQ